MSFQGIKAIACLEEEIAYPNEACQGRTLCSQSQATSFCNTRLPSRREAHGYVLHQGTRVRLLERIMAICVTTQRGAPVVDHAQQHGTYVFSDT